MRRTVRLLTLMALALLLWRRVTSRRERGSMMAGEKPDWSYAVERLRGIVAPPVKITPPPSGVRFEHDVEVTVRDGTVLRVNVFRPERDGSLPRHHVRLSLWKG
jgi:predicted acyl esterase